MLDVRLGCRLGLNTEQDGAGPGFGVCSFSPPLSCFQQRKGSLPACLPACWGSSRRTERGARGCFEPDVGEAEQPPVAGGYSAPASLPGGIQIQSSPRCERFVAASIVTWSDCLKLHTPSPGFGKAPRDAVAPPHPTCPLGGQVNSARPHAGHEPSSAPRWDWLGNDSVLLCDFREAPSIACLLHGCVCWAPPAARVVLPASRIAAAACPARCWLVQPETLSTHFGEQRAPGISTQGFA